MVATAKTWLALDVGGANLKGSHSSGTTLSLPFALWREPKRLGAALTGFASAFPSFDRLALTTTAELCDCYATKRIGVLAVLDAVAEAFPKLPIAVWGVDGRLHPEAEIRAAPRLAAAANWLALATVAARLIEHERGVLIDVGSTTTDLIPLHEGRPVPCGWTDAERLQTGELVYLGVRRTPVCALAEALPFRGRPTALTAELFATTLDLFLTLGDCADNPHDRETADGRPATRDHARDRLARMVGADREECSADDVRLLAEAAREAILARLVAAANRAGLAGDGRPAVAIVAGSGEFLAARLAARILGPEGRILSLSKCWGPDACRAACAWALRLLAEAETTSFAGG